MIAWLVDNGLIWTFWVALTAGLALISEGRHRSALWIILAGLLVTQVAKAVFDPIGDQDFRWVALATIWTAVSGAIWRHNVTISLLTLVSAMCYAIGRFGGYDFGPGSPLLFWADMAGLSALVVGGGRGVAMVGKRFRDRALGWIDYRRGRAFDILGRSKAPKE
jgi:hypothetical protein